MTPSSVATTALLLVGCVGQEPERLLAENQWYGVFGVWTEADECYVVTPVPPDIDLDCLDFEAGVVTFVMDPKGRCWQLTGAYACEFPPGWAQAADGFCSLSEPELLACCEGG